MAQPRHTQIRALLRKLWLWSPERRQALAEAKADGRGNGWFCDQCLKTTPKPQVDHIEPVGQTPGSKGAGDVTWDEFIDRLFVSADKLRVLCKPCHDQITLLQRQNAAAKRRKAH